MPSQDNKIYESNQYQKSNKAPLVIDADVECLREKTDGCKIILKNHLQQKWRNILHQVFQCLQYLYLET